MCFHCLENSLKSCFCWTQFWLSTIGCNQIHNCRISILHDFYLIWVMTHLKINAQCQEYYSCVRKSDLIPWEDFAVITGTYAHCLQFLSFTMWKWAMLSCLPSQSGGKTAKLKHINERGCLKKGVQYPRGATFSLLMKSDCRKS